MSNFEEYAKKKRFVDLLSEAYELSGDVVSIKYFHKPAGLYKEVVEIKYDGGAKAHINVAGDSCAEIAHEITRQISGPGAVGYIRTSWEEKR